jgi:ATP/maltotriose-dependent transcriptional regulator MalT
VTGKYQIIWGNRKKATEHGLCQKELTGKICYKLFFRRNYPCPKCSVSNALESKKAYTIEKRCEMATCRQEWCQQRAIPILDKNNEVAFIIVYGMHTTDKMIKAQRQDRYIENLENALFEMKKNPGDSVSTHVNRRLHSRLTVREVEVLNLVADGFTNPEISNILSISVHTAKTHVISIFNKLGVNNRTQAAVIAAFHQLITL